MADLGETFDPETVEADEFSPLPAGEYFAQIVESEMKPTKSGSGEMLKLTWQIIDGPHENRKFWEQLNIRNQNETAQRIALQALKKICEATGAGSITDSEELHNRPVFVRLVVKADANYGDRNEVKGYRAHVASAPAKPGPGKPPAKPTGSRPWGSKAA